MMKTGTNPSTKPDFGARLEQWHALQHELRQANDEVTRLNAEVKSAYGQKSYWNAELQRRLSQFDKAMDKARRIEDRLEKVRGTLDLRPSFLRWGGGDSWWRE